MHANHPRELTPPPAPPAAAAGRRRPLVSQSVLLKGVNDDVATLEALMRALRRGARQTLLSPPPRSRAGHRISHDDRRGPGADARAAAAPFGSGDADLRARHPRRARGKVPVGPNLVERGGRRLRRSRTLAEMATRYRDEV